MKPCLAETVNNLYLNAEVVKIDLSQKTVKLCTGESYPYDYLISTIPLKELVDMVCTVSPDIQKASRKLIFTSVLNFNLGINREKISDKHWIYFPEEKYTFYRVGFPMNIAPGMCPTGKSSLYAEIAYQQSDTIEKSALINQGIETNNILILASFKFCCNWYSPDSIKNSNASTCFCTAFFTSISSDSTN